MPGEERYTKWEEIGKGGFGNVYSVFDTTLQRNVAIKLLKKERCADPAAVAALHREVVISRDLRHENICPIHDVYEGPQGVGTVMDLIQGIELKKWQKQNRHQLLETAQDRLTIFKKLSAALTKIQEKKLVHRDLKPDNVFLLDGDPSRTVIIDFGTAIYEHEAKNQKYAIGTASYMSPEQRETPDKVDGRSDLFTLGVIAYELFSHGVKPTDSLKKTHAGKTPPKIDPASIPYPSSFCAAVPPALDQVIIKLLSYHPQERIGSAEELTKILDCISLSEPRFADQGKDQSQKQEVVSIPGGTFTMGSNKGGGITMKVHMSGFRMAIYPVRVREYKAFIQATGYSEPPYLNHPIYGKPDHPVVFVTHADALAYARWAGGNLPTEAQWEYAAKAGRKHPLFPWGDEPFSPGRANLYNESEVTTPVDAHPAGKNPYGLMDMSGNVWEWCRDTWNGKPHIGTDLEDQDPLYKASTGDKIIRGGAFDSAVSQGQCASRHHAPPDRRSRSIGFRLVFTEETPT